MRFSNELAAYQERATQMKKSGRDEAAARNQLEAEVNRLADSRNFNRSDLIPLTHAAEDWLLLLYHPAPDLPGMPSNAVE